MSMLRSILLASDLLPESDAATNVAIAVAKVFHSNISLLHAIHARHDSAPLLELQHGWGRRCLDQLVQRMKTANVAVEDIILETGHPSELIVGKAHELDVDLVIVGAGRRTQHGMVALGPVAETVIQQSEAPVLAVRPGTPEACFKKILCPIDFSVVSERGLRNAIGLARAFGGEVVVTTVVPEESWLAAAIETGAFMGAKETHERSWREEFDRFLLGIEFGEVPWRKDIRSGLPPHGILDAAHEHQPDVLVMGSTGRSGILRVLMGSVTRRVLQQLPCAVLIVKHEDAVGELLDEDLRWIHELAGEARAAFGAGNYREALRMYRQISARNPFDHEALTSQAEIHERLGDKKSAERCRKREHLLRRSGKP